MQYYAGNLIEDVTRFKIRPEGFIIDHVTVLYISTDAVCRSAARSVQSNFLFSFPFLSLSGRSLSLTPRHKRERMHYTASLLLL